MLGSNNRSDNGRHTARARPQVKTVIGFDLARSTGWAVFRGDKLLEYGVLKIARNKHRESVSKFFDLFLRYAPDEVAIEHIRFAKFADALSSYSRVRTLLEMAIETDGRLSTIHEVTPTGLKKWVTEYGRASKADMCRTAREWYGVDLWAVEETAPDGRIEAQRGREEDMADAIWVAAWCSQVALAGQ